MTLEVFSDLNCSMICTKKIPQYSSQSSLSILTHPTSAAGQLVSTLASLDKKGRQQMNVSTAPSALLGSLTCKLPLGTA